MRGLNRAQFSPAEAQVIHSVSAKPSIQVCSTTGKPLISDMDWVMQFFRKKTNFSSGQLIQLNKPTDTENVGEQNFDKDMLPIGMDHFVASKIAIGYATNTVVKDAKTGDIIHTTAFPAILRNAMLTIRQDGRKLLELPMALFDPRTVGNNVDDTFLPLLKPIKLIGKKGFQFEIRFPEGTTTVDTNYQYLEVKLKGISFRK